MLSATISISSTSNSCIFREKGEALAKDMNLSFFPRVQEVQTPYFLSFSENGLQLHSSTPKKKRTPLLHVDFVHGKNGYRLAHNRTIKQPLARAVGIKQGYRPVVFDGTAGLGGDGFTLASLGCRIILSERNPVMYKLLQDGLQRAQDAPITSEIATNNITLLKGNTIQQLAEIEEPIDTVYLDPMYPHRESSALGKQTMRVIRDIVGDDTDVELLFRVALDSKARRIAVKRPRKAPQISEIAPSHVIKGKSSRYDIYLK